MNTLLQFLLEHVSLITEVVKAIESGVEILPELAEKVKNHSELLAQMVAQKRAPTTDEITKLNAEIKVDEDELQKD